jgi:uncharacterized protein
VASQRSTSSPPEFHLLPGDRSLAFMPVGSRLYEIDRELHNALTNGESDAVARLEAATGGMPATDPNFSEIGEPTALSLNVAQACNLGCSYCYADKGQFGGRARMMSRDIAVAAVDRLIGASAGNRVTVGFIGGEPFLNRDLIHDVVAYATKRAAEGRIRIDFSVTTNGTALNRDDLDLLRTHPFAVTVSMDGGRATHDRHRRRHDGAGSFDGIVAGLAALLAAPGKSKIAARATVTRDV